MASGLFSRPTPTRYGGRPSLLPVNSASHTRGSAVSTGGMQRSLLLLLLLPSLGTFVLPYAYGLFSRPAPAPQPPPAPPSPDPRLALMEDPRDVVNAAMEGLRDSLPSGGDPYGGASEFISVHSHPLGSNLPEARSSGEDTDPLEAPTEDLGEPAESRTERVVTNCAVGIAKGLKREGIFTFVESLLNTTMDVHIYLYVDAIPAGMENTTEIRFIVFDQAALPGAWSHFHPSSYRYYIYHQFMQHTGRLYAKVQASDIRDIAFQRNPFDIVAEGEDTVHIFEEDSSMNIGKCWVNSNWVSACYGHSLLSRIRPRPISCSGYAIGTADAMTRYFESMAGEIGTNTHCEQNGIDQGIHNVLVNHELAAWRPSKGQVYSALPVFTSHSNELGPVFTGGYAPKGVYSQDAKGAFKNQGGELYSVLHQYDRHDYMTALVQKAAEEAMHARKARLPRSAEALPYSRQCPARGSPAPKAVIFTVYHDHTYEHWFRKRRSGELLFIDPLVEHLRGAGWEVVLVTERQQALDAAAAAATDPQVAARSTFFVDPDTLTNFIGLPDWERLRCRFRVLDFFGTPPHVAARTGGLHPLQYLTPYRSADNTLLGYPLPEGPAGLAGRAKKAQGVLWGKEAKYFLGHLPLIRRLAQTCTLLAFVSDGSTDLQAAGVQVRGVVAHERWLEAVAESRFILGFGNPVVGPSIMEALAVGTTYLDPQFPKPQAVGNGALYASQHPPALAFGPPHAFPVVLEDVAGVVAAVQRALEGPPHAPAVDAAYTLANYTARFDEDLACRNFCDAL